MFSLFSTQRKILGLDITEEYIRYALVSKSEHSNTLLLCGEEKIARVEPRNALLSTLRNILLKTKDHDVHISFPSDYVRPETVSIQGSSTRDIAVEIEFRLKEKNLLSHDESILYYEKFESINDREFYNVFVSSRDNVAFLKSVFIHSGLNVKKIVSHKDALLSSCVRKGEIVNSMVIHAESIRTDIAIFSAFNRFKGISSSFERERIPKVIKETYQDFYELSRDKIGYFFVSGSLARDVSFINYLSKETRLPIQEANVLTNFDFKKGEVPPITKEESLLYALALGSAIS